MQIYETNYQRLRTLTPNLDLAEQTAYAAGEGLPPLYLRVLHRFRYTTMLRLTHFFDDGEAMTPLPNVFVRVYHDARLAEAAALREAPTASPPYSKWEQNRFLERWLGYCLRQGYRFSGPCVTPARPHRLSDVAL